MPASIPLMVWPGSRGAVVSTNPIAVAVPAGPARAPLLLDMATSAVANGGIMAAKDAGTPIPEGWGVDASGAATTDAAEVATLLPLGGPKGAGLSLAIECLASIAALNPVIGPALRGELATGETRMNGVAIALDTAAFGDTGAFAGEVASLADAVRGQPRAAGVDRLMVPGERGDAVKARRLAEGIPLPKATWTRLTAEAARRGVPLPAITPG